MAAIIIVCAIAIIMVWRIKWTVTERIILTLIIVIVGAMLIDKPIEKATTEKAEITEEKTEEVEKRESKAEKARKIKEISEGLNVVEDDMKELIYYYSPQDYEIGIKLLPYAVINKKGEAAIYDCPVCNGDEWLFFDTVYIKYEGKVHEKRYERRYRQSEVSGKWTTELYSEPLVGEWYEVIKKASSIEGEVKIRFSGKYKIDKVLSDKEKAAIRKVIKIYETMKE